MAFVESVLPDPHGMQVLEVGSYNENGSVRPLFDGCASYIGVDTRDGLGVDKVIEARDPYPFEPRQFDLVVSTEMLEHALDPWHAIDQMARVLRSGGILILTCRGFDERGSYPMHGEKEHGDYWRFSVAGLSELVLGAGLDIKEATPDPSEPGVFLVAVKP